MRLAIRQQEVQWGPGVSAGRRQTCHHSEAANLLPAQGHQLGKGRTMKTTLVRSLENAVASLESIQDKGLPQVADALDGIGRALQLVRNQTTELSHTAGSRHRFVATDRFNNVRYLTVHASNIRLWSANGQAESLSSIAHDNTQQLIFALEDAASEEEMLAALNQLSYQTWRTYTPER
jgi:hypothetical protein